MYDPTFSELQSTDKITENLEHRISHSFKNDVIYLEIRYLDGKFTINKIFQNNYEGKELLEATIKQFDNEDKVKAYLNI